VNEELTTTTTTLEELEAKAERGLEKTETGWREFAEAMREIKESEEYKQRGYRHFAGYYREHWQERTGKTYGTVRHIMQGLGALEEMFAAEEGQRASHLGDLGYTEAKILRSELPEPGQRVEAWEHHQSTGRQIGRNREGLRDSIREYKGEEPGVIEEAQSRGIVVPPEPAGKTPSEAAWLKMAEASRVIRGVEPADAARVESGRVAARYVEQMEELAEWARLFAHELRFYAEETGNPERR
jgi:hypothetical protein